jgi:hypothetical protein
VTYNKLNAAAENEAAENVLNVFFENVVITQVYLGKNNDAEAIKWIDTWYN